MEDSLNRPVLKGFLDSSFGLARNDNGAFSLKKSVFQQPQVPLLFPILLLACLIFFTPSFALAADLEESSPEAPAVESWRLIRTDALNIQPDFDPNLPNYYAGPYYWSRFNRRYGNSLHEFTVNGGLSTWWEAQPFGEDAPLSGYQGTFTYRYHGLFGGVIRPVTRVTVGTRQWMEPGGPPGSFDGYRAGTSTYFIPEAGVEIVYKGYGLGMTASYPFIDQPAPWEEALTEERITPQNRAQILEALIKNLYLVIE